MTTPQPAIPDGSYHYFLPGRVDKPPRLCEINNGYAYFTDDSAPVRVDKLSGTFVLLTETGLPLTVQPASKSAKEASE